MKILYFTLFFTFVSLFGCQTQSSNTYQPPSLLPKLTKEEAKANLEKNRKIFAKMMAERPLISNNGYFSSESLSKLNCNNKDDELLHFILDGKNVTVEKEKFSKANIKLSSKFEFSKPSKEVEEILNSENSDKISCKENPLKVESISMYLDDAQKSDSPVFRISEMNEYTKKERKWVLNQAEQAKNSKNCKKKSGFLYCNVLQNTMMEIDDDTGFLYYFSLDQISQMNEGENYFAKCNSACVVYDSISSELYFEFIFFDKKAQKDAIKYFIKSKELAQNIVLETQNMN